MNIEYVYVVALSGGQFKIGVSKNVGKRFHTFFNGEGRSINDEPLKTGAPLRVCYSAFSEKARVVERLAHKIMRVKYPDDMPRGGHMAETYVCTEQEAVRAVMLAEVMA